MLNRWIGIMSFALMAVVNVAIVCRDVLPGWLAGDPPPSEACTLGSGEERCTQVGIYDQSGRAVGTSWTRSRRAGASGLVQVYATTVLESIALPGGVATPRIRVETELTYRNQEGTVDELDFRVYGLGVVLWFHGEAMPSGEFPCEWQVGDERGSVILEARATAALGDVIRPFDRLPHLYVGRSWRLNLLDPMSHLLPQVKTTGLGLEPVLIQVTRMETIVHNGVPEEVFVVEGGGATAWVAPDGTVLRQTVNLPLLGQLTLLDEPYSNEARAKALQAVSPDWAPRRVRNLE